MLRTRPDLPRPLLQANPGHPSPLLLSPGGMRFLQAHDAPKDIDPSQLSGFQRFVMGGLAKIGLAPGVRTAVPVEVVQAGEEGR